MRQHTAFGDSFEAGSDHEFDRTTRRALDLALDPPLDLMFVLDLAAPALHTVVAGGVVLLVLVRRCVRMTAGGGKLDAGRTWEGSAVAGLLGLAARLLPPEHRARFVEEQCGNLAEARTRLEWLVYLSDLLAEMPWIAVEQHHEHRGQPL